MTRRPRSSSVSTSNGAIPKACASSPARLRMPARFVIAIASGKGGVGKSTIALNLAVALGETGRDVGLLDADFYAPDIPLMVGLKRSERLTRWDLWRHPTLRQIRIP